MWRASRFPPPECLEARALPPKNGLQPNDLRRTDQPSLDAFIDRHCESACKKDPLFGVIGFQSGPRNRGSTLASMILGSRGWDAGRGEDCKDPARVFKARQVHQSDLSGVGRIPESRKEGDPFRGD